MRAIKIAISQSRLNFNLKFCEISVKIASKVKVRNKMCNQLTWNIHTYLFLGPLLHRRVGELVRLLLGRPRRAAAVLSMLLLLHLLLLRLLLLLQHMVGVVGRRERGPVLWRNDTGVGGLCN